MVIGVYICIHKLVYACKGVEGQAFFQCSGSGCVHRAVHRGGHWPDAADAAADHMWIWL